MKPTFAPIHYIWIVLKSVIKKKFYEKIATYLVLFAITVLLISCKTEDYKESDVYVVGNNDGGIAIWKNGEVQNLTDGNSWATASSIFVSEGNVYIAGFKLGESVGIIWKNGMAQHLSDGKAISLYVSGKDVYVAGVGDWDEENINTVKLWKNGVAQNLTNNGYAHSVFVFGNDVYVTGEIGNQAVLWKNGVREDLTKGYYAVSVFVVEK